MGKKFNISSKDEDSFIPSAKVNKNGRVVTPSEEGGEEYDESWEDIEQKLSEIQFDNMEKDDLLQEIQKVDREYLRINMRLSGLSKTKRHVFKGDSDALTLQLRALKQRSDMLFKCLDKVLPDKKELTGSLNLNTTKADQIPDKILKKIALGTITDEEYEHYAHLFEEEQKQLANEKQTKH